MPATGEGLIPSESGSPGFIRGIGWANHVGKMVLLPADVSDPRKPVVAVGIIKVTACIVPSRVTSSPPSSRMDQTASARLRPCELAPVISSTTLHLLRPPLLPPSLPIFLTGPSSPPSRGEISQIYTQSPVRSSSQPVDRLFGTRPQGATLKPGRHRLTTNVPQLPIMATPHPHTGPVGPDTPITVKVIIDGTNRRFKLPLRDLGANVLPQKVCGSDKWESASMPPTSRL